MVAHHVRERGSHDVVETGILEGFKYRPLPLPMIPTVTRSLGAVATRPRAEAGTMTGAATAPARAPAPFGRKSRRLSSGIIAIGWAVAQFSPAISVPVEHSTDPQRRFSSPADTRDRPAPLLRYHLNLTPAVGRIKRFPESGIKTRAAESV